MVGYGVGEGTWDTERERGGIVWFYTRGFFLLSVHTKFHCSTGDAGCDTSTFSVLVMQFSALVSKLLLRSYPIMFTQTINLQV